MPPFDTTAFRVLNQDAANGFFDAVFPVLTSLHQQKWFFVALALFAVSALWRGSRRTRLWVLAAIVAVSLSDLLCSKVIKRVIARERPCQAVARLRALSASDTRDPAPDTRHLAPDTRHAERTPPRHAERNPARHAERSEASAFAVAVRVVNPDRCPGSPSFPSNHAANMMAVASVGWWFARRRARWAWFLLPLVIGYTRVYLGYHYPTDVVGGWAVGAVVAAFTLGLVRMAQRRLNCDCQPRAQEAASVPTNSDV